MLGTRSMGRAIALSLVGASIPLFATGAPAAARLRAISGKLSRPGYTVMALAANGRATSVRAPRGAFRLQPPGGTVTLELRAPNGTYAGPVVTGRQGQYAFVGVRAGARLGLVR